MFYFFIYLEKFTSFFSSMEVFPKFHPAPFSKMLTFYRKEPFLLTAQYTYPNEISFPTTKMGKSVALTTYIIGLRSKPDNYCNVCLQE